MMVMAMVEMIGGDGDENEGDDGNGDDDGDDGDGGKD